jgi:hydrogenase maturation protein HypF
LDFGGTIRAILDDKRRGEDVGVIAAKFHNSVAAAILRTCQWMRDERGIETVALSGGVFQNELLLCRTVEALQTQEFKVFTNTLVPPNDGGLALGQAAVAAARMKDGREKREEGNGNDATTCGTCQSGKGLEHKACV